MILGKPKAELADDEVDRIAREVALATRAVSSPPRGREETAGFLDTLAATSSGPVAEALASIASHARGEWPEDDDLPRLARLGGDLADMQRVQDELTSDALARVAEAEGARAQLAGDLDRFVAAASAGDETAAGRLQARVEALEVQLRNVAVKLERAPPTAGVPGSGAGSGAAADGPGGGSNTATLVNELRGRVSRLEAENGTLRTRLGGLEAQLAHIERILEAAAGFAAEERAPAPAAAQG